MSQIYNLEPPTSGSIILDTTHGPLHINLWSTECPQTTRNFVQHCLNRYYDNLVFHRIIPDVLVQTGDPTNTGTGGDASTDDPVPMEAHGRLRFRRRGLVAMVCEQGVSKSQFFITLGKTEWLNGQHTIFGEVVGESIYNLLSIGERGVDGFEVEGCPRVTGAKVVQNPFDGMVGRKVDNVVAERVVNAKVGVRKWNALSFIDSDDEEDEDEDMGVGVGMGVRRKVDVSKRRRSRFGEREDVSREDESGVKRMEDVKRDEVEDEEEIVKKANEEFERLKAQLAAEDAKQEVNERSRSERVKKKRRDESGIASRLKAFESRIKKSRHEAKRDEGGRVRGAWFERGLRLGTRAMEEEEYEVHFGRVRRR